MGSDSWKVNIVPGACVIRIAPGDFFFHMKFDDIVEAKEYIERRGIEKIAMTRRVRIV